MSRAALMTAIPVFGLAAVAAASPVGYAEVTNAANADDSGAPLGLVVNMQAFEAATPDQMLETSLDGRGLTLRDGSQASFVVSNAMSGRIAAWNGMLMDPVPFATSAIANMGLPDGSDSSVSNSNNGRTDNSSGAFDSTPTGALAGAFLPRSDGATYVSGLPVFGDSVGSALTQNAFGDLGGGAIAGMNTGSTVNGFDPVTGSTLGALPTASGSGGSGDAGVTGPATTLPAADPDTPVLPSLPNGPNVIAAIPEPGTIALLGIGLAALAVSRKRLSA
jgi:hypothetical protein